MDRFSFCYKIISEVFLLVSCMQPLAGCLENWELGSGEWGVGSVGNGSQISNSPVSEFFHFKVLLIAVLKQHNI